MNSDFKKVTTYVDSILGCKLNKWIAEDTDWAEKIDVMYDVVDISVLQKCWTSILYGLPINIVTVGYSNDRNVEILSDYKEIFALMQIYGISKKVRLFIDPFSCELALEPGPGYYPLEDIYDTFRLVELQKTMEGWLVSDDKKKEAYDNTNVVNSRMQQFYITIRNVCTYDDVLKDSVINSLKAFYNK